MAAKEFHEGIAWPDWDKDLVVRKSDSIKKWKDKLSDSILYQKFVQFIFHQQWTDVKNYANSKGIKIIGDMPIFVAYDSSDVWANNKIFTLDKEGKLEYVAGVPPDYFSETGQLWGNPLFIWEEMEKDEFKWWRDRFTKLLEFVDIVRIDHFRGFDAFWRIPGDSKTAQTGKWIKAPGEKLFNTLKKYLGELPILAEDLGVITKSVEALRDKFEFPGMKILQFAFGTGMENKFLPHNITKNSVVYTGSHDNDTTRAYFEKEKNADNDIYEHAQKYLDFYGNELVPKLIRTAYSTVADFVIIPMQDVLNLGSEARMNYPGKLGGNWTWRFSWTQIPDYLAGAYRELAELYERPPKPREEVEIETS
jgi:4-alpha-glucanotransferase